MKRKRVAILISGRGSNMAALIEAAKDKTYPAEIVAVISNRPDAGGLTVARANGIATEVVDQAASGKDRRAFERALQAALEKNRVEIVCLAGFMRLLTAGFVGGWEGRMLNIHPALLPSFKGLETHKRALEAGVKLHGATVHFVVPEMDSGPSWRRPLLQCEDDDTEETLAARVIQVEHQIYSLALKLVPKAACELCLAGARSTASPCRTALFLPPKRKTPGGFSTAHAIVPPPRNTLLAAGL